MQIPHSCEYPEILIEESDEDGPLRAGMKVLAPCSCGETPFDGMDTIERLRQETQDALLAHRPSTQIYHWTPSSRRKQINRYGLRPGMRPTTSSEVCYPVVCFADSPAWAWALSGGMRWTPTGEWDLWQTWLEALTEPIVLASADRPSGIYEIRTEHRVYKRDLWLVGSRNKPA